MPYVRTPSRRLARLSPRPDLRFVLRVVAAACLFAAGAAKSAHAGDAAPAAPAARSPAPKVILLHGLGRSRWSMTPLARRLEDRGFDAVTFGYSSLSKPVAALAADLAAFVEANAGAGADDVHFVGHSLGNLIVRAYLKDRPQYRGRVVMLAPPNQGSEIVDRFRDDWWFGDTLGPAARQLGTRPGDVPALLGPVSFPAGVIAGNRSINPLGSWILPGPDDGAVAVSKTPVEGMTDFCVVPKSHTFIMWSDDVADQTEHFLKTGHFTTGCEPGYRP